MDDISAFERQVARRFQHHAGPVRPVNDAAIFTAISATQSPKWRFQSMFSATKFVVAGAIVALFGGVLLAGVLTEPSDERVPAPAATTFGPGTFSPAGSPAEPRTYHSATLLPDGRVLVIGGMGEGGRTASSEVWDPATASFSPVGSLAEARHTHTATLLSDGRVLVVGGFDEDGVGLVSAEVWDPETAEFSPAGTLAEGHAVHTATLLPDGRVLVVGGYRKFQHSATTAEVWDPATASFSPADVLTPGRLYHTATLLPDGDVLIVGGGDRFGEPHAEVWGPETESSQSVGSLVEWRLLHTATLLSDGRVLIVGGDGDETGERPTTVAEVWDPETASFSPVGSPRVEGRRAHTATALPDGRVLIVGGDSGFNDEYVVHASAELWDPATASFSPAGSLAEGRAYHTATLLPDGRVLVIGGGIDGVGPVTSAEIWDPSDRVESADTETTDDATRPDLLPGVDLVTEEVEPGVYRVLNDGVRDLSMPHYRTPSEARGEGGWQPSAIVAGLDGSLWYFREDRFFRLGDVEEHDLARQQGGEADLAKHFDDIAVDPGGTLWDLDGFGGQELRSFDGEGWAIRMPGSSDAPLLGFGMGTDGTIWTATPLDRGERTLVARLDPEGPMTIEQTVPGSIGLNRIAVDADGQPWLLTFTGDLSQQRLYRRMGTGWQEEKMPSGQPSVFDIGTDGRVWVAVQRDDPDWATELAYHDGTTWRVLDASDGVPEMLPLDLGAIHAAPDGSAWVWTADGRSLCGGIANVAPTGIRRYLDGLCVHDSDVDVDGTAWVVAGKPRAQGTVDLYVITPEAGTE